MAAGMQVVWAMKACDAVAKRDVVQGAGRGPGKAVEVKGAFAAKLKEKVGSAKKDGELDGKIAKKDGTDGTESPSAESPKKDSASMTAVLVTARGEVPGEMSVVDRLPGKVSAGEEKVLAKGRDVVARGATVGKDEEADKGTAGEVGPQGLAVTAMKAVEAAVGSAPSLIVPAAVGASSGVIVEKVSHVGEATVKAQLEAPQEQARLLVASGNVLEVGVAAGTHGWLRVRAELSTGGDISAQVIASSGVAAESLHKDVPAMTAYLASEQVGLSSLVVHAPQESAGAQDVAMSFGAGAGAGGRSDEEGGGEPQVERGQEFVLEISGGEVLQALSGSGGWLNVRV